MKFFGRQEEVEMLRRWRDVSAEEAQFVVITGRRRVGKTALLRNALDDGVIPYVHLPITRRSERMLCRELQAEVEQILKRRRQDDSPWFSTSFRNLTELTMRYSARLPQYGMNIIRLQRSIWWCAEA